ncbi:MAG: alpha/beta hydrolase [Cyanobacteria bacterium REEB67]|nr:alpha/beta hydrolase [Cyanobacteria bacterium REEB67]
MKDKAFQTSAIKEGRSLSGIHYRLTSSGPGRQTLVLVMGYGGSLRIWPQSFIDRLSTIYDVLTYDNRGTGLSFLPPGEEDYTTETMAGDLDSVVESLGLSHFHLLGYSMGGCIAIEYAHLYRQKVASLFLLSTTGGGALFHRPDRALSGALANPQGNSLWALYEWTFKLMYSDEAYTRVEPVLKTLFEAAKDTPTKPQALKGHSHAFKHFNGENYLDKLTMPVTLLSGENDRIMPVANTLALAKALPQAKVVIVPGVEHGVHIECESLVVEEINELIARRSGS